MPGRSPHEDYFLKFQLCLLYLFERLGTKKNHLTVRRGGFLGMQELSVSQNWARKHAGFDGLPSTFRLDYFHRKFLTC